MKSWKFNEVEDELLQGLPCRTQVVYMRGLRPYMTFKTGIVGIKRGVSYGSLSETSEERRLAGSTIKESLPTRQAMRTALDQLEKVGLIKRLSQGRKLILLLPLADSDKTAEMSNNQSATIEEQISNTPAKPQQNAAVEQISNRPPTHTKPVRSNIPPVTGIRNTTTHRSKASSAPAKTKELSVGSNPNFVFPKAISPEDRQTITVKLKAVSAEKAQPIIDALAAGMKTKGIPSPIGYVVRLIERVNDGTFNAAPSQAIHKARTEPLRASKIESYVTPDNMSTDEVLADLAAKYAGVSLAEWKTQLGMPV